MAVTDVASIRLYGAGGRHAAWGSLTVAGVHEDRSPSTDDIRKVLRDGPATFAMADKVTPADLSGVRSDADITVIVADASAGGRASPDLAAGIWRDAPGVALFLGESLLEVGAVTFSLRAAERLPSGPSWPGDPVTAAVAKLVADGASIQAVVLPGAALGTSPADPAVLTPAGGRPPGDLLGRLDESRLLGRIGSRPDAAAVRAGLLLWNDLLDESHAVSQLIEGEGRRRAGDHWHAIMHRREPDYGNAKYWFRRIGRTSVHRAVAARAQRLAAEAGGPGGRLLGRFCVGGDWDAAGFVDACEEAARSGDFELDRLLRRVQADEMLLLLHATCEDAVAEAARH